MNSPNESIYSYILRTYHGDDVHKRKKTVLFKDVPKIIDDIVILSEGWNPASARINHKNLKKMISLLSDEARLFLIFRLIIYLYIRPFLRLSFLIFLILFRFYHSMHPEIISARMNESLLIRSFWTNYYTNPGFLSKVHFVNPTITPCNRQGLTNTYYYPINPGIQSNLQDEAGLNINSSVNKDNIGSNNTVSTVSTVSTISKKGNRSIGYLNHSNLKLSNSRRQVVFSAKTNNIATKKLLQRVITTINNTMILVDFTTPVSPIQSTQYRPLTHLDKTFATKSRITDQIIIGKPMSYLPIKLKQNKQKSKTTSGNKNTNTNTKSKYKSKKSSRPDSNELIYGYVNLEKKIVAIYENGDVYFYKVSKEFIYKYLMSSRQLNTF